MGRGRVAGAVAALLIVASGAHLAARGAAIEPRVPAAAGTFAPSLARGEARGSELADVDTCASCHASQAAQWRASAHSFASFDNPIYRASIEAMRREVGFVASRHCGGCHDPALLVDGALDREVAPLDPRGHAGVTCRVCHGTSAASAEGNGSYELGAAPLPLPLPGDPGSLREHRRAVVPPDDLCLSCHRSFLGEATGNVQFVAGMDDVGAWQRSRRGRGLGEWLAVEDVPRETCRGCHMPGGSHRFAGAHTWMAALRGDAEQRRAIEARLRGAATVDIAAVSTAAGDAWLAPTRLDTTASDDWLFDVVVANRRVGHRFPGGVADVGAAWLEVAVVDGQGRVLAVSGARPDSDAHVLRAQLVDAHGRPVDNRQVHRVRARAWDRTLASGDAQLVRFRWRRSERQAPPAAVRVRLWHQTRLDAVVDEACRAAKTARGRAFSQAATGRPTARSCSSPPRVLVSETSLGVAEYTGENQRAWQRLYDLGRGRLSDTQERVEAAREPLQRALAVAPSDRARAAVLLALGRLAVRQGRTGRALWWFGWARLSLAAGVRASSGGTADGAADDAVVDRWIGRALASVWRWRAAVAPLERAFQAAPGDPSAAVDLATALVALGAGPRSRAVIRAGLEQEPRNPTLLRLQRLAWTGDARARRAYTDNLRADDGHDLAAACARRSAACARERRPIHEHLLRSRR